ncbi:MAG: serine/threonine-protein kinase, partial [Luteimonas sp.]
MTPSGADGSHPPWWLDPAIAQLAFGASAHAQATGLPGFDSERVELDLDDPEQRRLGEFELLELIGEGGMGLVYRAQQTHLQREVAVKLLSSGPWASPGYIARFQQEARHAAKLQHPAIVTVFEMGELEGLVYYAMQLVRGESLAQHLQRQGGKLPEARAAELMRTVAEAVDYAHTLGVLHLDLKPANILLDEEGQPRVADFGLSRFMGPDANLDNLQTAGTPSYMAPEQAVTDGAALGRATDVWGLGAILYELLCGQPPFEAADASSTLLLLQQGVVRRPSRFGRMSPDLEAICLKCLAKSADQRYPTARALADDLGRFLEGRAISVHALSTPQRAWHRARREPKLAAASGLAVFALLAGLVATNQQWQRAEGNAMTARERLWESRRDAAPRLEQAGAGWEARPRLRQNAKEQAQAGRD